MVGYYIKCYRVDYGDVAGYYQSSGAFGFRDQLQDVMSLTHVAPNFFVRIYYYVLHISLRKEMCSIGGIHHQNRGVRTRCSDDYLWLPFAICHYIETTGDMAVLDEEIPFLQGRPLNPMKNRITNYR